MSGYSTHFEDSGRSLRILVVDDNRVRADAIARQLEVSGCDFAIVSPATARELASVFEAEVVFWTLEGDDLKNAEDSFDLRSLLAPQELIVIALTEDRDRAARLRTTGSGFDYAIPRNSPSQEFQRVLYWANRLRWQESLRAEAKDETRLTLSRVS